MFSSEGIAFSTSSAKASPYLYMPYTIPQNIAASITCFLEIYYNFFFISYGIICWI